MIIKIKNKTINCIFNKKNKTIQTINTNERFFKRLYKGKEKFVIKYKDRKNIIKTTIIIEEIKNLSPMLQDVIDGNRDILIKFKEV